MIFVRKTICWAIQGETSLVVNSNIKKSIMKNAPWVLIIMMGMLLSLEEICSGILIQDEYLELNLELEEGTVTRRAPLRIWRNSIENKNKKEENNDELIEPINIVQKTKIVLALHGLFDHKGAYHELALNLLEESKDDHSLMMIAADFPTYGGSDDRDQPMPPHPVMKQYVMALLTQLSDRYPQGEFYLLGESLGGSMILMASRELQDFQTERECIGGAIVISPAVHNPATSLYFQRRSLQMSAEPNIFRRIWFNDPEVNHQNAFSRVRTTIPYLSEAYNSAFHWPTSIPCAVLVASKDSVVTKPPLLSLYRSLDRDNIAFYAFPSRHLILRSCSENGKYIEHTLIHRDIGALISLMGDKLFNAQVTLPHTGAMSETTMNWYASVYRSWVGGVSGYLSSWPITHLDDSFQLLQDNTDDDIF